MKNFVFVLVLSALTCIGCASKGTEYVGTWKGDVLVVFTEYTFTKDTFVQRSYSFNNVLVGGASGTMSVENGVMKITEDQRYNYNPEKNNGTWGNSVDQYIMKYSVSGNTITLQPETSKESMKLVKQ
jgi:hypothetical protein